MLIRTSCSCLPTLWGSIPRRGGHWCSTQPGGQKPTWQWWEQAAHEVVQCFAGVLFRIAYWHIIGTSSILGKLIPHDSSDYSIQAVEAHMSTYKVSVVPSPRSHILIELALEWQLKGRLFQEKQAKKKATSPCFLARNKKKHTGNQYQFRPIQSVSSWVFSEFLSESVHVVLKSFWSMSNFEMSSSFSTILQVGPSYRWMVKTTDFGATFHGVAGASTRCRRGKIELMKLNLWSFWKMICNGGWHDWYGLNLCGTWEAWRERKIVKGT